MNNGIKTVLSMSRREVMGTMAASLMLVPGTMWAAPKPKPPATPPAPPDVDALIAALRKTGRLGYVALSAADGAVLAEDQADLAMAPASTLKTVTALYALDRLGRDHRFVTRVLRDGDRLVLAGGGDPVLDTDSLAVLAKDTAVALAATGAPPPTRFEVWGGALPSISQVVEKQADYLAYNPALSGMVLNYNRVHLGWAPAPAGPVITFTAEAAQRAPAVAGFALDLVERSQPLFDYHPDDAVERWSVSAKAIKGKGARWLPVRRPELYAGEVFRSLCAAEGLKLPAPRTAATAEGQELARHIGEPLEDILRKMLKYSTNVTAEVVGLTASGAADLPASAGAMEQWLRTQGVGGNFHFRDHSGLSPDNSASARVLAETLRGPGRHMALASLLRREVIEFKGEKPVPGRNVVGKTGTLNFVSNLVGYAENDGRAVIFAVLTDDPARHAETDGMEAPKGIHGWLARSRTVQRLLIRRWINA